MTCLEHLIENCLCKFEDGKPYEEIEKTIENDINLADSGITAEQCFEICLYVWGTFLPYGGYEKINDGDIILTKKDMQKYANINVFLGLLIEFDEMRYSPTILCKNPEKEAKKLQGKLRKAFVAGIAAILNDSKVEIEKARKETAIEILKDLKEILEKDDYDYYYFEWKGIAKKYDVEVEE